MSQKATYKVKFRRRREGKTNYDKRIDLIKSKLPRMVVRISNKNVLCQIIEYSEKGDKVLCSAHSNELKKFEWNGGKSNTPASYLVGLLCGAKGKKTGIKKMVLDIGLKTPVHGSKVFAALKGAIDAGIELPFNESALPSNERILGKHIQSFAESLEGEEINKRFSISDVKKIMEKTEEIKEKILKEFNAVK